LTQISSQRPILLRRNTTAVDENKIPRLNDKKAHGFNSGVSEVEIDQNGSDNNVRKGFKSEEENPQTTTEMNGLEDEETEQTAHDKILEKNVSFEEGANPTEYDDPSIIQPSASQASADRKHRRSRSLRSSFRNFMVNADFNIDEALNSLVWKTDGESEDKVFGREYETKMEQARDTLNVPPIFAFNYLFLNDWILTYLSETNNFELKVTDWHKNETYGVMQREVSYVRPLTHRMGPKQTRVQEKQTYSYTSDGGVLIESEARNLDVPFGDNFLVESYFHLKPTFGGKKTDFIAYIAVHFAKRTMLRGAIESATIAETKRSFETLIQLAVKQIEESVPETHVALFLRRMRRPSLFDQLWDITKNLRLRESSG